MDIQQSNMQSIGGPAVWNAFFKVCIYIYS